MKKRIVSLILGLCLALSGFTFAGCAKESYDFTVWVPMVNNVVGNFGDHAVFKELEKRTGKKVKFVMDDNTGLHDKFASGNYYDVMILNDSFPGFGGTYKGGIEKGIQDGVIRDISALIEEKAPNYLKSLTDIKGVEPYVVTDSGKKTAFYELVKEPQGPWYGYMMREDWLIKAGWTNPDGSVRLPETYDDWEEIFKAFQNYNKTNSDANRAPLFLYKEGVDPFNSLSAGYGVTFGFQRDGEGKVSYGPYMDGFKGYLDKMRAWYAAGYIHHDFMLSDEYVPILGAVGSGNEPAQYGVYPQMYIYMTQNEKTAAVMGNEEYRMVAVPNPKVNASDKLHVRQVGFPAGGYAVITNKCADPASVVEWFDYIYSDEAKNLMNYGIEGDTYNLVDGKPQYTDKVKNPGKISTADAIKKYSVHSFPMNIDWKRELQVVADKEKKAIEETWVKDNDGAYVMPNVSLTTAENDEFTTKMTSLEAYVKRFIYQYIAGQTNDSFDKYRKYLQDNGIERMIEIQQGAYDRWLARSSEK